MSNVQRYRSAILVLLFTGIIAGSAAGQTAILSGIWEGPYQLSLKCEPGTPTPASGRMRVVLTGPDDGAYGIATLTDVPFDNTDCVPTELVTVSLPISGSLQNGHFSGAVVFPGAEVILSGDATANRLNLLILGEDQGRVDLQRIGAAPTESLTGTYEGSATIEEDVSSVCQNMSVLRYGGPVVGVVAQDGEAVTASLLVTGLKRVQSNSGQCTVIEDGAGVLAMSGVFENPSIEGFFLTEGSGFIFNATASGSTITGEGEEESIAFDFTMTRTADTTLPSVSGTYVGTHTTTDDHSERCTNFDTLSYSGPIVIDLAQVGPVVSGRITTSGVVHAFSSPPWPSHCTSGEVPPDVSLVAGTFDGTTANLWIESEEEVVSAAVTIIEGTLTARIAEGLARWNADATKTTSSAPAVTVFKPISPSVQPGGETTLSWSVYNAASVTIDHGIGPQPATGSVTVRPAETTTYTLTAAGPLQTVTATATVVVSSGSAPAAPSNLTAAAISSSLIQLTWSDNSTDETEFRIEQQIGAAFEDVASVPSNTTTVDVTGLSPATSYIFRVRARNVSGDSAPSNEATATTLANTQPCVPNTTTVCLLSGRFRVTINYKNPFSSPPGQPGDFLGARLNPNAINPDTSIWGFGSPENVEVVVRIVDARPFAPRFDIYYGGLTDVEYFVHVTDTVTGRYRQYYNAVGQVGGGVDRSTFPAE